VSAARRLARRSFRSSDRAFLAEGPQAVREAVDTPGTLLELFVTADAQARYPDIVAAAHRHGVPVHQASGEVLGSVSQTVTPQGMVGVCRFLDVPLDTALAAAPRLMVLLANVRDPGNAGTVVRTADAAGVDAVVLTDACVDVYNPKCVRASAGSLFHVPVVVGAAVEPAVAAVRAAGLRVLAADGAGPADLGDRLTAGALTGPVCWVFGNEAWGLPEQIRKLADEVIRVPIHGRAESLNLASAAAVCLYATTWAQRGPDGCRHEPDQRGGQG
jgi:TrmH family RNA methyltransferase